MPTFLSPWWLTLLAPWAALLLWIMWGRRQRQTVPFLDLWPREEAQQERRRAFEPPPLGVSLALLAALLAIVALARPVVGGGKIGLTVVVDHSPRMAGRFESSLQDIQRELQSAGLSDATVVYAPDAPGVRRAVRSALDEAGAAILLSDTPTPDDVGAGVVRVAPNAVTQNVGLVSIGMRATPVPAVMVRVRNDSSNGRIELVVGTTRQWIDLPPAGSERSYFGDMGEVTERTDVELIVADDFPADNAALVRRTRAWPRVRLDSAPSPAAARVIGAYAILRPPSDSSPLLRVVSSIEDARDTPAIVVPAVDSVPMQTGTILTDDHPVNIEIRWDVLASASVAPVAPPGWQPVASAGGRTLLAVRQNPARRVWIGFVSPEFERDPAFVLLWTNLLDWAGTGGDAFAVDGVLNVKFDAPPTPAWEEELQSMLTERRRRSIVPVVALLALLSLAAGAVLWNRAADAR